ncbi:hypothetical protein T492DRAFT_35440 [Pavlovales sp. CCMP2436]|nr:hypothetical protein T492DRAFT_35440 [Pavlovales sp. CCMP2436]
MSIANVDSRVNIGEALLKGGFAREGGVQVALESKAAGGSDALARVSFEDRGALLRVGYRLVPDCPTLRKEFERRGFVQRRPGGCGFVLIAEAVRVAVDAAGLPAAMLLPHLYLPTN